MGDFKFDIEKFVNDLTTLGATVKFNSDKPGIFTSVDGEEVELSAQDLFPEFRRLRTTGKFQTEKLELPVPIEVKIEQRDMLFTELDSTTGAA